MYNEIENKLGMSKEEAEIKTDAELEEEVKIVKGKLGETKELLRKNACKVEQS